MSEIYWALLGVYVFINFVALITTIKSLQKSYKNWKSSLEWCNNTLIESPTWEHCITKKNKAQAKTNYYKRLKKACFWLSPILLFTLIPIYLLFFIKECFVWIYETYKD